MPELVGCTLTFDALHTVMKTVELAVVDKRAGVLIQVKGNSPDLQRRAQRALSRKRADAQYARTVDAEHGRIEARQIEVVPTSPLETGWPHTHAICRVIRDRETVRRGQTVSQSHEEAIYVGSFAATTHTADKVLSLTRGHWGIENCLHHRKDRSMDEDRCRASQKGIGRVMCCVRSLAALVLGRAKESLSVVRRRFSGKPHIILSLLFSNSLDAWEQSRRPYTLA